ncbi:MAG: cell wall binding protein [Clostridiaceae bacterium]|jgi:hypothetical protein|nr:cell wall binding protein [Clostridiaceae bacterium]
MLTKPKLMEKWTAVLAAALLVVNIFAGISVKAAVPETIAAWDYTSAAVSPVIPATSGSLAAGAALTNFKDAVPTYSSGSLSINGWDKGQGTKYWQISLSAKGYDTVTLSAKARSSGTGPRDFKVIYSINNGTTWKDVPNGAYVIKSSTLSNSISNLLLPNEAADVENLEIRIIMTSNISSRAGTSTYSETEEVTPAGTSNINNIVVTGVPVTNATTVAGITAVPPGGSEVALGSKVALNCETQGAAIIYSINDGEFTAYNPESQISITSLPAVIKAYGTKDGFTNSVTSTFNYTQGKVSAVTASPNGGAVILNKLVTLSCSTSNAIIKYSLDDGANWSNYSEPIKLSTLPAVIKAYAICEGLLDGSISTFSFTEKGNSDYSLYFGQLHSHTGYSDGQETPDYAYNYAKDTAKVDFLAVTDHSNSLDSASTSTITDGSKSPEWINGHSAADKYTDGNFVGIYGYEMTWSNGIGHINTFNTPGFESRDTAKYKAADGLKQYYDVLKQCPDSISQLNHPGPTFGDFNDFAYYDPEIDKEISLIEVGNGEGAVRSNGYFPSYEFYTRALDKGWHLSPTNNQDNHLGKWGNANTARTVVLTDTLTRDNIYDAMRNMRTYATEDNDLHIKYTLNGEVMGTIFPEKPASVDIKVDLEDPDNEPLGKVSVISNGGKIVASKTLSTSKESVEFLLPPDYSYYYIRVDEADKDIAVTAPVWIGEVDKAGISNTICSTTLPIKGESFKVTTNLFNNEAVPMTINSLVYSIDGAVINRAPELQAVNSLSTSSYSFNYTAVSAGKFNIDVKLNATINGVERVFTDVLKIDVTDPALVTRVAADGSHFNDYVNGYYANNLGNFTALANNEKITVNIEKTKLTDEILKDAKLLIISAPAKKSGTANGVSYQPQSFNDEDIAVIKRFVDNGGNLMVCGIADYQDGTGEYQTSTQMNRLLEGIGATSRFNNDEVIDNTQKLNNQNFRLAFDDYNMDSPYLNGVMPGQAYSFYSGCSLNLDSNALSSGKTTWLVKGHDTTESIDSNKNLTGVALPKGSVYALAVEQLNGGGKMFIGGTVYISDFEVKATLDNSTQLQNSNYNITMNILDSIKKQISITPINQVRSAEKGNVFCVEGTVTAGKIPADNSFFDTLYIQDETGGINLFPVSGTDIRVGEKVKAIGTVDEYQGDRELRVMEYSVTDTAIKPLNPTTMTTRDSMDSKNGGMLAEIEGIVTKMDSQNIYVDDGSGEARAFVDGYIGDGSGDPLKLGKWDSNIQLGDKVNIAGLSSMDAMGPRLRVRNTAEIIRIKDTVPPVITISGISNNGIYNKDAVPVVTTDKGTYTMTLNGSNYNGEIITAEGNYTLTVKAVNRDGYYSEKTITFSIDKTAPEFSIIGISNGEAVKLNERVAITWTFTDNGSGIEAYYGDVKNGDILDTSKVGTNTLTFTAYDRAGNETVKTITYFVNYDYSGTLNPVNNDGSSVFKAKSTVPVKFQLKDADGNYISNAVSELYIADITNGNVGTEFMAVLDFEEGYKNLFRYDNVDNQYIFNLNTKKLVPGTYQLRIELDDGTTKITTITLR